MKLLLLHPNIDTNIITRLGITPGGMVREKKTRKSTLLQLVESHRTANGKVSQRIVMSLGGCPVPDQHRKAVAVEISHRMAGYQRFFPIDEPDVVYWTEQVLNRLEEAGKLPGAIFHEQLRIPVKSAGHSGT